MKTGSSIPQAAEGSSPGVKRNNEQKFCPVEPHDLVQRESYFRMVLRTTLRIGRRRWSSGRLRPQFQHSLNCPSSSSPQPSQCHDFFTEINGASVFFTIAMASTNLSSSSTQSSGQHSIGGISPAAVERSRLRVTHSMPKVTSTFLMWPTIRGSFAE